MHYHILDFIRFVCASYVVLYHLFFRSVAMGDYNDGLYSPVMWTKYGWLGVQVFFVVSGFVIYKSSLNKTPLNFIVNRFLRLYPAYWVCLFLTISFMFLFNSTWWSFDVQQLVVNFTMLQFFLGVKHVDGVYWTLTIELVFYFWVFVFLYFKKINLIKHFLFLCMLVSLSVYVFDVEIPSGLLFVFLVKYSPYFLIGVLLSEGFRKKWLNIWYFSFSLFSVFFEIDNKTKFIEMKSGVPVSTVAACFIFLFFILSVYFSFKVNIKSSKVSFVMAVLGAASYPLYLLHQNVSYVIVSNYYNENAAVFIFACVLLLVLTMSILVSEVIEPKLRLKLKSKIFIHLLNYR